MAGERMWRIGEVGRRAGMAASALRYYESLGLLEPDGREGATRVYRDTVFERLAAIDLLRQAGFSLAEIGQLLADGSARDRDWRESAVSKLAEVRRRIHDLGDAERILEHVIGCPSERVTSCRSYRRLIEAHARALASGADPSAPISRSAARAGLDP